MALVVEAVNGPGVVVLEATDDGAVVAQVVAVVEPNLGAGRRFRIDGLWIAPDRRGDDEFAAVLYPAFIYKAIELGWVTDDDVLAAEMADEGLVAGPVLIRLDTAGHHDAVLRFRLIGRDVQEAILAEPENVGKTLPDDLLSVGPVADVMELAALPEGDLEALRAEAPAAADVPGELPPVDTSRLRRP